MFADRIVNTIGSFSTALGNACKCDPWAVEIFAEEVVRGGPAFAISLVISGVEPRLRQLAELGAWQVCVLPACACCFNCCRAVQTLLMAVYRYSLPGQILALLLIGPKCAPLSCCQTPADVLYWCVVCLLCVQVISPHQVMGIVEIVEHLSTVQDKVYDEPTVLVVDNVTGMR